MKQLIVVLVFFVSKSLFAQCPQVLDQNFTAVNVGSSGLDQVQSFTAGMSGKLTRLDVNKNGISSINFTLSIYQGDGTGGTLLYSNGYTFTNVSNWLTLNIPIGSAPTLVNGSQYTYRIESATSIGWTSNLSNAYAGGSYTDDGLARPTYDLNFKTYIQQDPPPVASIASSNNPTCFLAVDGSINTNVSSGLAPYTFNWSPSGQTNQNATNLSAGNHTLTVTDNQGCVASTSLTLTDPSDITINAGADQTVCSGTAAPINATATNALFYSWSPATNLSSTTTLNTTATPTSTTTYTVTASNLAGCNKTDDITITVDPLPTVTAPTDFSVCDGQSVTLTGTGTATGYTWDNGVTNNTSFTPGVGSVNYTVTGTDGNGCINTDAVSVSVNALPNVVANCSDTDLNVCDGESFTLNGSGASTYVWDNGVTNNVAVTAPVGSITYVVTGTDGNGCVNTDNISINVNALPTVAAQASTTNMCEGDQLTLFGQPAVGPMDVFTWDNGVIDNASFVPGVGSTTYTIILTDGTTGCTETDNVTVTVNALPTVTAPTDYDVCDGATITLAGTGTATSYAWDNGISDNIGFTAPVGFVNYTVIGTDASTTCTNTDNVTVTVNALPIVTASGDYSVCGADASILLAGSGSAGNVYTWNNGVTNSVFFVPGLGAVNYIVTGTNSATGCSNTDDVTVTVLAEPTVTITADQDICDGDDITINANGAVSYVWDNGLGAGSSHLVTPLTTTEYFVTSTGVNTCTKVDSVTISVQSYPVISASADVTTCASDVTTISATGAPNYTWDNGLGAGNTHNVNPTTTTKYFVSSTNGFGCTALDSVEVTVNSLPVIVANATDNLLCEGDQVTLTGQGGVSYVWDNGVADGTPSTPAIGNVTYTVIGTDVNNCQNTDQIDIDVNPIPTVNAGADITQCENEEVIFLATGANTYIWSSGATNGTGVLYTPGNYNFTVTGADANGCEDTDDFTFTINGVPVLITSDDQYFCKDDVISLNVSGATTYDWENGASTTSTYELQPTSSSSVVVKGESNGCEAEKIIELFYDDPINISAGDDQEICPNFVASLNAMGGNTFVWNGPNVENMTSQSIDVTPEFSDYYHVTVSTDYCEYKDSVFVDIKIDPSCGIENSNTISPNGDGVNDEWVIDGIAAFPQNSVLIYNRWGDIVFEAQNYDNVNVKWVGEQLNGDDAISGTYFYQINLTDGPSYSGWIELMR
jgi:gliding motility-associated-like protein